MSSPLTGSRAYVYTAHVDLNYESIDDFWDYSGRYELKKISGSHQDPGYELQVIRKKTRDVFYSD